MVTLHYAIVLCGAERVKTISIQNLQSLCFDGVRLVNVAEFPRDLEARSQALARLPRPGDRAGFLFDLSRAQEAAGAIRPPTQPADSRGEVPAGSSASS